MNDDSDWRDVEGGCACGHVRFRMAAPPIIVHGCHCRFCQRRSGSAFAVNAMIETDRLVFLGAGRPEPVHTPSALPAGQEVLRCPGCRTALWSHHSELGEAIAHVAVGVLDRAERISPDVHCYTATRHPWVVLPDDVPCFEAAYDPAAVWSRAVEERVEAALKFRAGSV